LEPHKNGFKITFRDITGPQTGTATFIGDPSAPVVTYKTNLTNFNAGIERSFPSNKGGVFIREKLTTE